MVMPSRLVVRYQRLVSQLVSELERAEHLDPASREFLGSQLTELVVTRGGLSVFDQMVDQSDGILRRVRQRIAEEFDIDVEQALEQINRRGRERAAANQRRTILLRSEVTISRNENLSWSVFPMNLSILSASTADISLVGYPDPAHSPFSIMDMDARRDAHA